MAFEEELCFEDVYAWTILSFGGYQVDVVVFVDKDAHDRYISGDGWGSWHPYPYRIDSILARKDGQENLGRLGFVYRHISAKVVFHEMTHMQLMWADMLGIGYSEHDEYIAEAVGKFAGAFYAWFYKEELQNG